MNSLTQICRQPHITHAKSKRWKNILRHPNGPEQKRNRQTEIWRSQSLQTDTTQLNTQHKKHSTEGTHLAKPKNNIFQMYLPYSKKNSFYFRGDWILFWFWLNKSTSTEQKMKCKHLQCERKSKAKLSNSGKNDLKFLWFFLFSVRFVKMKFTRNPKKYYFPIYF